jgi:hypothetical protein
VICPGGLNSPVGSTACQTSYPIYSYFTERIPAGRIRRYDHNSSSVATLNYVGDVPDHPMGIEISPDQTYMLVCCPYNNYISKYSFSDMTLRKIAGGGASGILAGRADGFGTNALMNRPSIVRIFPDGLSALIVETTLHLICRIRLSDNYVNLLTGTHAGYVEGVGSEITSSDITSLVISADGTFAVFAQRGGCYIRKLAFSGATVTSSFLAGGICASAVDGIGSVARFYDSYSLMITPDQTAVIFLDGHVHRRVRKLDLTTRMVSTIGVLTETFADFGGVLSPMMNYVLFTSNTERLGRFDMVNKTIRYVAGSGVRSYLDHVNGSLAQFTDPIGIATWKCRLIGYGLHVSGDVCEQCPRGTYGPGTGNCIQCPAGTTSVVVGLKTVGQCYSCASGYYPFTDGAQTTTCLPCTDNSGSVFPSAECTANPGYYMTSASTASPCTVGTYSTVGVCTVCPVGTYSAAAGASVCTVCAGGTFLGTGATGCSCPAGMDDSAVAGICAPCAANTYKASAGTAACVACSVNFRSEAGAVECGVDAGYCVGDDSFLAYYGFKGDIYADNSGNGYTLTSTNGALYQPTYDATNAPFPGAGAAYLNNQGVNYIGVEVNRALTAPAQSFRMTVGVGINLDNIARSSGFSYCYWIKGANGAIPGVLNSIGFPIILGIYDSFSAQSSPAYGIEETRESGLADTSTVTTYVIANRVKGATVSSARRVTQNWVHTCVVFHNSAVTMYVDCASKTCAPSSVVSSTNIASVFMQFILFGQGASGTAFFGWMSELRLYKKGLTAAEVFSVRSYTGTRALVIGTPSRSTCPAGTFSTNGVCNTCPAGTYSAAVSSACISCQVNYYSSAAASVCVACPSNSWSPVGGRECIPNLGYYKSGSSILGCSPSCSANTYGRCTPSGTAVCCGAGTYFVEGVSNNCGQCPSGTYGSGISATCTPCAPGLNSPPGSGVCAESYPMYALIPNARYTWGNMLDIGTGAVTKIPYNVSQDSSIAMSPRGDFLLVTGMYSWPTVGAQSHDCVFKVEIGTWITTVIAGPGRGSADGIGAAASFYLPNSIKISPDGSYALFSDKRNCNIRRLTLSSGLVERIAGNMVEGYAEGVGTAILMGWVEGLDISADGSFVLFTSNNRLRKLVF